MPLHFVELQIPPSPLSLSFSLCLSLMYAVHMYLTLIQLFNPTQQSTIYGYHSRDSSNEISQTNETSSLLPSLLPTFLCHCFHLFLVLFWIPLSFLLFFWQSSRIQVGLPHDNPIGSRTFNLVRSAACGCSIILRKHINYGIYRVIYIYI